MKLPDSPLVGTVWRINDSASLFVVREVDSADITNGFIPRAWVETPSGTRGRWIQADSIRTTKSKTGYTQVLDHTGAELP